MSWRVVVISNRAKLDLQLGYLVVRAEVTKKVHLSEISVLLIEHTGVSLTAALLTVTEKQFNGMETIIGNNNSEVINGTERLVIL